MPVSNRIKLLVPLVILAYPIAFWFSISCGKNHFKRLPVLGPVQVTASGDSVFHTIPDFHLTDQLGRPVSQKDLDGRIYVANFFFASCQSVCPPMNENMRRIQEKFKGIDDIRLVSYTVDPDNDTVQALAAYAKKLKADNDQWLFLTGPKDSIYDLARTGYLLPAAQRIQENDFFHSQDILLIDKEKRIRGIYDGTEKYEVDTLMDEIKVLMHEYFEKDKK
ncbi:MAG: SCO family protein [Bacteroidota bacterium]